MSDYKLTIEIEADNLQGLINELNMIKGSLNNGDTNYFTNFEGDDSNYWFDVRDNDGKIVEVINE